MTSHSTVSKPGTSRGQVGQRFREVSASSLRQGIWMISFIGTGKDGIAHVRLIDSHGGLHAHPAGAGHRSPAARDERLGPRRPLAKLAFALLCVGFAIGFFVFPTYPVYDSYYSLLWGRDLLHGDPLVFEGFRYPTEHPLAIAAGALLQLFGGWADRLWVALILASFLVLIAGVYRLGRLAATPLVGAVAAALLMTRFDYPFLAARGYIDIPYMALVVWAATLEAQAAAARDPGAVAARLRGHVAARGVVPRGDVLRLGLVARVVARPVHLRGARGARSADLGDGRFPGHRQPAVLAAVHELQRRGSRPPAPAERAPGGDPRPSSRTSSSCPCSSPRASGCVRSCDFAPADADADRPAGRRAGDVHRDRRRRRVGDRALSGRPGAGPDGARGGDDRGLDDARRRAGSGTLWMHRRRRRS